MALRLLVCCSLVCLVTATSRVRRIINGDRAQIPPSPSEYIPFSTPEPDYRSPLEFVTGIKRAQVLGISNPDGTHSFLGIPYAVPPTKNRRFLRPLRLKLKDVIIADKFKPPCPQWWRGNLVGDEDCLYLNVFTPQIPDGNNSSSLLPVMLWIHGGNFKTGSASQYVPVGKLIKSGIVVVTIQYRLGSLGFMKFGKQDLGGNAGLFDIRMASRWVKDYIHFFGGDPNRVTVAGQGSGASSVSHLSIHRYLRKHIKGIILMSGSPVSSFAIDENAARSGTEVAAVTSCIGDSGIVATIRCLQRLPFEFIVEADRSIEQIMMQNEKNVGKKLASLFLSGPTVEGKDDFRFLPNFIIETPFGALSQNHIPNVPLLVGVTKQETGGGVKGNLLQYINGLSANFLSQGIFKDLLTANTGLYINNTVNPSLRKLFDSSQYLELFDKLVGSGLNFVDKVIQHTTDALFNLPAFILSDLWSQKNKNVYLYSFEHTPTKSLANYFLNGITLVPSTTSEQSDKGPSHGDDLAYLFDVRHIDGEPIYELDNALSVADEMVRDHFVTVVAEFVKTGKPRIGGVNFWAPFNKQEGNYMIIKENPRLDKGFRKCNMAMWTGESDILQSPDCALTGVREIFTGTIGKAGAGLISQRISGVSQDFNKPGNGVWVKIARPIWVEITPHKQTAAAK